MAGRERCLKMPLFSPHIWPVLKKAMATHSSTLAWKIPWTEEPGGLPSMGSQSRARLKRLSSSSSSMGGLGKWFLPLSTCVLVDIPAILL